MIRISKKAVFLALVFVAKSVFAQSDHSVSNIKYYLGSNMHPKDFDVWMDEKYTAITNGIEINPDSIESVVASRFDKGMFTSEYAIIIGIKIISYFEVVINKSNDYVKTIKFIDSVVSTSYGQELTKIKLLQKKGDLLKNGKLFEKNRYNNSKKSYEESISLLDPLTLELNLMRNEANMEIGNIVFKGFQDKENAEEYFIEVQRFPFWLIRNGDYFFKFRQLYINAGHRRLEINRGNLRKLYTLAFVPAVSEELYPIWKSYIEEVGGEWDIDE